MRLRQHKWSSADCCVCYHAGSTGGSKCQRGGESGRKTQMPLRNPKATRVLFGKTGCWHVSLGILSISVCRYIKNPSSLNIFVELSLFRNLENNKKKPSSSSFISDYCVAVTGKIVCKTFEQVLQVHTVRDLEKKC